MKGPARLWQAAGNMLDALLWPRGVLCLVCGEPTHGTLLCEDCTAMLGEERTHGDACPRCASLPEEDGCPVCPGKPGVDGARSAWRHEGCARALVHALKFNRIQDAARLLSVGMAEEARTLPLPPDTVVTWVTMPEKRRKQRGCDHGRLLAEAVAEALHLPVRQLLERADVGKEHTQQGLNRAERQNNLKGRFSCNLAVPPNVLLVDDVLTTGVTAETCARCMKESGGMRVWVVTATRARV